MLHVPQYGGPFYLFEGVYITYKQDPLTHILLVFLPERGHCVDAPLYPDPQYREQIVHLTGMCVILDTVLKDALNQNPL